MNRFLKINVLGLYLLALASLVFELPWGSGPILRTIAMATVAIHMVELVFAFKHVRAYRGPLLQSVALTLLFGLMHWLPIAKATARADAADKATTA